MIAHETLSPWFGKAPPNAARLYNYYLGGKDNFAAERHAAERVIEKFPDACLLARANRNFLIRAARFCAEQGVDQFLDIGPGIPTGPAVHDVVRAVRPRARVVGAASDPVVLCHTRALVDNGDAVRIIEGDLRSPAGILTDPVLARTLDPGRPVAVLLVAVADFTQDNGRVAGAVAALREWLPSGSFLVFSHATSTGSDQRLAARFEEVYAGTASPLVFRSRDWINGVLDGRHLVDPGLVDVQRWRPEADAEEPVVEVRIIGGVERKP